MIPRADKPEVQPLDSSVQTESVYVSGDRQSLGANISACLTDPGPCEFVCGKCYLCRCHNRFAFILYPSPPPKPA